ncbi:hypothetical protein C8J56DRAFT_957475 [Mycena floridula]|nr:hypothetical protein C8J56DRAFT_1169320 [Mycena floridula]KAJ7582298.1 hypothetical protein C8J56DRAFT_957475 [Mycena floridula]
MFPAEIWDSIIDFGHNDTRFLAICGLVCRNWLPSSRYHLFRTVHITEMNQLAWRRIIIMPSVTFHGLVAGISLSVVDPYGDHTTLAHDFAACLATPFLASAKTLSITGLVINTESSGFEYLADSLLYHIEALELQPLLSDRTCDLLQFLSLFPALTSLRLHMTPWQRHMWNRRPIESSYSLGRSLTSFDIAYAAQGNSDLVTSMLNQPVLKLTTLVLRTIAYETTLAPITNLIQQLGDGLTNLSLMFVALWDENSEHLHHKQEELLSLMQVCQSKPIRVLAFGVGRVAVWDTPWFLQSLASLQNLDVLNVLVDTRWVTSRQILKSSMIWEWMEMHFGTQTTTLKEIRISCDPWGGLIQHMPSLAYRKTLKQCNAKGLLRFE